MSEDWDFYLLRVDDRPGSIYVDLGIVQEVPLERFETMAFLSVKLRFPREDGLSSREEFDALVEFEDTVVPELIRSENAVFVGRCTTDGRRDFCFYVIEEEEFARTAKSMMQRFAEYEFKIGSRSDPDWKTYLEFLYPSPVEMQVIMNRRVCINLEESGDDLGQARDIDHFAFFPSSEVRSQFVAHLEKTGFSIASLPLEPDEDRGYAVAFVRSDKPAEIDSIAIPLYEKAVELGGEYDGWGCPAVS